MHGTQSQQALPKILMTEFVKILPLHPWLRLSGIDHVEPRHDEVGSDPEKDQQNQKDAEEIDRCQHAQRTLHNQGLSPDTPHRACP